MAYRGALRLAGLAGGISSFLCTMGDETSCPILRIPLSIGPELCRISDTNFREFLYYDVGRDGIGPGPSLLACNLTPDVRESRRQAVRLARLERQSMRRPNRRLRRGLASAEFRALAPGKR